MHINSENSSGSLKERIRIDILRSEGVAGLQEIRNERGSKYKQSALEQRETLKDYFTNENIISWQLEHVETCVPV